MCGIYCSVLKNQNPKEGGTINKLLDVLLHNRGPDYTACKRTCGNVEFRGFVLWQQGDKLCQQPSENEHVTLLFNGDIFNLQSIKPIAMSDTEWLIHELSKCHEDSDICGFLSHLEGPYSLIFINEETRELYFARDSLGRNSLLVEHNNENELRLLSVSMKQHECQTVMELPPLGLFKINLDYLKNWTLFPWHNLEDVEYANELLLVEKTLHVNINVSTFIDCKWLNEPKKPLNVGFNLYELFDENCKLIPSEIYEILLANDDIFKSLSVFDNLLANSVAQRVQKTTQFCNSCILRHDKYEKCCHHAKIAILFSGGIDCTILAVVADKYVPETDEIDLINVAFEAKKTTKSQQDHYHNMWNVPDRISARSSYAELKRLCPKRKWNLVEVNVTREDLHEQLHTHIKHLIYPLSTVLDESIGCAFWFAARGEGLHNGEAYNSTARVILLGSGADELFGGYVRHRNAYRRSAGTLAEKLQSVCWELERDWKRIPARNLARDDRVIADNSKTARAPFIEERLVQFVRSLRPEQRCCYELEEGLGDKIFLRSYGYMLGLREACSLRKRAIQFGSRIADKKQNAQDISSYLKFNELEIN